MPDILLPFVICGGFITNIVGVCIILKHLAEQTTLHKQIHIIKGTGFFPTDIFFWIVKLTVSVVDSFFPTPTTTDEVDLLSPFLWGTALPGLKTRLQSRHGFIEPWFHCWSRSIMISLKRKTNQLIPIDGIQDQSFFLVNQSFSWSYNYRLFEWTIKCCVCGQVCTWLNN